MFPFRSALYYNFIFYLQLTLHIVGLCVSCAIDEPLLRDVRYKCEPMPDAHCFKMYWCANRHESLRFTIHPLLLHFHFKTLFSNRPLDIVIVVLRVSVHTNPEVSKENWLHIVFKSCVPKFLKFNYLLKNHLEKLNENVIVIETVL